MLRARRFHLFAIAIAVAMLAALVPGSTASANGITYNVTYFGNGETSGAPPADATDYTFEAEVTVLLNTGALVKTNHTFDSWNESPDGLGMSHPFGSTFLIDGDVDLYAQWVCDPCYSVTYDGNTNTGGQAPSDFMQYATGGTVTVADNTGALTKTDNTFAGWNTAANGTGTSYAANDTFNIADNTTLYAKWTANGGGGGGGGDTPVTTPTTTPVPTYVPVTPTTSEQNSPTVPAVALTQSQVSAPGTSYVVVGTGSQEAAVTCGQVSSTTGLTTACATTAVDLRCLNTSATTAMGTTRGANKSSSGLNPRLLAVAISVPSLRVAGITRVNDAPDAGFTPLDRIMPTSAVPVSATVLGLTIAQLLAGLPQVPDTSPIVTYNYVPAGASVPGSVQPACQAGPATAGTTSATAKHATRMKLEAEPVGMTIAQGSVLQVLATGLNPRTPVSIYIGVPAVSLGTLTSDDAGAIYALVRVPTTTPTGATALQVNGRMINGLNVSFINGISVRVAQRHAVKATVAFTAGTTKLTSAQRATIKTLLGKVPATVPVSCTVRGIPTGDTPQGAAASATSAKLVNADLHGYGLKCRTIPAPLTGDPVVKVQMNFSN